MEQKSHGWELVSKEYDELCAEEGDAKMTHECEQLGQCRHEEVCK